jgi:fatty acid synthase subunit alpha, fungi type
LPSSTPKLRTSPSKTFWAIVDKLVQRVYNDDVSKIPTVDYLGPEPKALPQRTGIQKVDVRGEVTYTLDKSLPEPSSWLETLTGPDLSWLGALLTSVTIIQGTSYIDNPIQRLLAPCPDQKVIALPTSIIVHGAPRSFGFPKDGFKAVDVLYTPSSGRIDITIFEERLGVSVPPLLHFEYKPSMASAPIHDIADGRNERIKQFTGSFGTGITRCCPQLILETSLRARRLLSRQKLWRSSARLSGIRVRFKVMRSSDVTAPMDFAIVTGWQVSLLIRSLFHNPL